MKLTVKNVHLVSKKLACGHWTAYVYAWRGGPRIGLATSEKRERAKAAVLAEMATDQGLARLSAALETQDKISRARPSIQFIAGVILRYIESPEYEGLAHRTRSDYRGHLDAFSKEFGDWRLSLFDDPRIAQDMAEWRDAHPSSRQGDMRMSVVSALFSWARSRGLTAARPTESVRKIYHVDRADRIWSDAELERLLDKASEPMAFAIRLAVATGLRQGDLVRLPWSAVSDIAIRFRTSKRKREALIPLTSESRELLAEIPRRSPIVLTSQTGKPWTSNGLRASFTKLKRRAGFPTSGEESLRWHDFRGTAITRLYKSGLTLRDLSRIFGLAEQKIEAILDRYVSGEAVVQGMIERMSGEQSCKLPVNRKQGEPDNDP